ncbi:MAG: sigma 54-interacting transcriptional regulator [Myxococcales bacterium]|nr:sigma 54-interacting transcriptional regulator [Myxococcales bacterium]
MSTVIRQDLVGEQARLARATPTLTWRDDSGEREYSIDSQRVTLGSGNGVEVVVSDREVSRLHAELTVEPDGLWVRDLGSRNGTYVQGVRVRGARLAGQPSFVVGSTTVTLHQLGAPKPLSLWPEPRFGSLLGASPCMRELFTVLSKIAPRVDPVLIHGETGSGKELVARSIHEASNRSDGPFVTFDCGAVSESLFDSEFFGHRQGSFTGATSDRDGSFIQADGGTLFLDEVGELPLSLQVRIIRALETASVRRLGDNQEIKVDVRVVAATHRDLRQMVNAGTMREDLYFRLAVLPVHVPPLRERREDVPLLAELFTPPGGVLAPEWLSAYRECPWVGNVRELRSVVRRMAALGPENETRAQAHAAKSFSEAREAAIASFERDYLGQLMASHDRNVAKVAKVAGVSEAYVYRIVKKHSL